MNKLKELNVGIQLWPVALALVIITFFVTLTIDEGLRTKYEAQVELAKIELDIVTVEMVTQELVTIQTNIEDSK